jgi:hypothetical protein
MIQRLIESKGELSGDDLTIKLSDFTAMEQALLSSPSPYEFSTEASTGRKHSHKRRRSPQPSESHDSDASPDSRGPRYAVVPLVTDVTDATAVERAVDEFTPSYLAQVLPRASLCCMVRRGVDYRTYLSEAIRLYEVVGQAAMISQSAGAASARADAESQAKITRENMRLMADIEAQKVKDAADIEVQKTKHEAEIEARKLKDAAENMKLTADIEARKVKDAADIEAQKVKDAAEIEARKIKDAAEIARAASLASVETEAKKEEIRRANARMDHELAQSSAQPSSRPVARKPSALIRLTSDVAEIDALWRKAFAGTADSRDEMVICTLHLNAQDYHAARVTDCRAFNTQDLSMNPNDRANFAPAAKKCLKALQIPGAEVFPDTADALRRQLHRYYSLAVTPVNARGERLLRLMELPCNVSRVSRPVVKMHWDHLRSVSAGGRDLPENLHFVSSNVNLAVGEEDTRSWATANGFGALLTAPPSADALAACEALPWWDGKTTFDLVPPRERHVRAQYPHPWPVVAAQHQRLLRAAGQSTLRFPPSSVVCHSTACSAVVLSPAGTAIPGVAAKSGHFHYCAHHGALHAAGLARARQRRHTLAAAQ